MQRWIVTAVATALLPLAVSAAHLRRGGIAFHYATPLTPAQLAFYSRFEVLVTHDPLPRAQVEALHRAGTKLALYEWSVAFYGSLATPAHRALPLLNTRGLRGHLGAVDADAFYYDPAAPEHESRRAEAIAARLAAIGYDGVFLDTTTVSSVHPAARAEYERRHPDLPYDAAFARFLRTLRRRVRVIVTNQGYRDARHYLPYADWDISESLITWPRHGRFVFRPWNDPLDPWNSIAVLMHRVIAPAQRRYPRVRFAHLNYLDAVDSKRVEAIVAIARLFDADAFVAVPSLSGAAPSEAYFRDFGRGRSRVEHEEGARRTFEHGTIAVTVTGGDAQAAVRAR